MPSRRRLVPRPGHPPFSSRESGACLLKVPVESKHKAAGLCQAFFFFLGERGRGSGQTPADPEVTEKTKAGLGDPTQAVRKWEGGGQHARADGQVHWEMWWLLLNPQTAIRSVQGPRELPKEAHPWAG